MLRLVSPVALLLASAILPTTTAGLRAQDDAPPKKGPKARKTALVVARVDDPYGLEAADAPRLDALSIGLFVDAAITGRELNDVFDSS